MKTYSPQYQTALSGRKPVTRGFLVLALPSGTRGFWTGRGYYSWSGINFVGSGNLINVDIAPQTSGFDANGMTLKMYENPALGLTPSVLRTIFQERYRGQRVAYYSALFDPGTRLRVDEPERRFSGYVGPVEEKTDGGETYLEGKCYGRAIDNTDRGWEKANAAHHARVSSTDKFFEFAAETGRVALYFGGPVPKLAAPSAVPQ